MEIISDFIVELFTFRNDSHRSWFYVTITVFILVSLGSFILRKGELAGSVAGGFLGVALSAVVVYVFGIETEAYSVDCIWYNSLLSILLFGIKFLIERKNNINLNPSS